MQNRQDFFNSVADRWDSGLIEDASKFRRVVEAADLRDNQRILDIGTGTGILLPFITERAGYSSEIYAIDFAERMIESLKEKRIHCNISPIVMDIHKTSFEGNFFDRVIANSCYPHFEDKRKALSEIYRILKEDGLFIISHPTGRTHVNRIHKMAHRLVEKDVLPDTVSLKLFAEGEGLKTLMSVDEPDFFLMVFSKQG